MSSRPAKRPRTLQKPNTTFLNLPPNMLRLIAGRLNTTSRARLSTTIKNKTLQNNLKAMTQERTTELRNCVKLAAIMALKRRYSYEARTVFGGASVHDAAKKMGLVKRPYPGGYQGFEGKYFVCKTHPPGHMPGVPGYGYGNMYKGDYTNIQIHRKDPSLRTFPHNRALLAGIYVKPDYFMPSDPSVFMRKGSARLASTKRDFAILEQVLRDINSGILHRISINKVNNRHRT